MLHTLQIALHHVALLLVILYQVGHLQQSSIHSPDTIDARIVVFLLHRAYCLHNFLRLSIFANTCRGSGIHARNMDDGFLRGVQHLTDMVQIVAMIEMITQHQVFQILVAVQLLIVVIGNGIEPGLVLYSQHGYAVAAEVRTRHRHDMPRRVVHHASHHITQIRVGISRGMVKFIDSQERVVEVLVRYLLHAIAQRGVGTHQNLCSRLTEEFYEAAFLVFLVLHIRQVEVGSHLPVGKESVGPQFRVLKRAPDALFRHRHHHLLQSLMHQLVQSDEHQRTAFARCWRSLNQQETLLPGLVSLGLHLTHTQSVGGCCFACLLVAYVNDVIAILFHICLSFLFLFVSLQ